ncbi:MAG: nitric oxide synthase [Rhodospirillaceae bacterium]|jgi:MioC protein|nr:nitric oxide synthase [Rhodospirillaceae bacterium]MBT6139867.1 nitric oxide synthase [Rhodospirillaceae bacterium]
MLVRILVATQSGNAEIAADEMAETLADLGTDSLVMAMDDLDPSVFARDAVYVICTATYGQGDVPDNGQALYTALGREKPDLSGITYGVFTLGDLTYKETFCHGGKRFDEALTARGAQRIGEVYRHDAGSGTLAEDDAIDWIKVWYSQLQSVGIDA